MIRPRLQGSRSRIARAQDSIPDRHAPVRFIGRRRLKLALQDKAFLHLSARSEMAEGINAIRVPAFSGGAMPVQASAIPAGFASGCIDPGSKTGKSALFATHATANRPFPKNPF
ncbi:MAG TPA: hypothetical protein VNJ49_14130 [Bradyrhizobium sp.]|nr:hypothetical protein [Bradyrhizobium sp.]